MQNAPASRLSPRARAVLWRLRQHAGPLGPARARALVRTIPNRVEQVAVRLALLERGIRQLEATRRQAESLRARASRRDDVITMARTDEIARFAAWAVARMRQLAEPV